jgi:hypothetical protein
VESQNDWKGILAIIVILCGIAAAVWYVYTQKGQLPEVQQVAGTASE